MRKFKKYYLIALTRIQSNMAYAVNFLFSSLFYAFIIFVFLMLWKTVYTKGGTISGYSLNQMIWYCIITEMVYLSSGNVFGELNNDIKGGNIAYVLNKPYNYLLYQLSNVSGQMGLKIFFNVITGILIGILYVGPMEGFHLAYLPFGILSMLLGILLNFFVLAAIGMTAFWIEENSAFFWIVSKLTFILGMLVPVEFLPKWLQSIALSLPFSYITYGPARLVVKFSLQEFGSIIMMQAIYLAFFIFLSYAIYSRGVRKLNVNGG